MLRLRLIPGKILKQVISRRLAGLYRENSVVGFTNNQPSQWTSLLCRWGFWVGRKCSSSFASVAGHLQSHDTLVYIIWRNRAARLYLWRSFCCWPTNSCLGWPTLPVCPGWSGLSTKSPTSQETLQSQAIMMVDHPTHLHFEDHPLQHNYILGPNSFSGLIPMVWMKL